MGKLLEIKDFNEHWYNNGHSTSFGLPYGNNIKLGTRIKTPMSVDCLDNRRRRVYMDNTVFSYTLYVYIGGEKCILCDPKNELPVGWSSVGSLVTKQWS